MPSLGADMEAGTLLEWFVEPGSAVKRGDIVALVDTDKAEIEIEIFEDGVIDQLLVEPGSEVAVGTVLATLTGAPAGEGAPAAAPSPPAPTPPAPAPAPVAATPLPPSEVPHHLRPRISPLARRAAEQLHVEIAGLQGTGLGEAITLHDVEAVAGSTLADAESAPPVAAQTSPVAQPASVGQVASGAESAPATPSAEPQGRAPALRRATAALMARSKREIPHYYLERTIDLHRAMTWMTARNADLPPSERLIPAALLLVASARAARAVPEVNGRYEHDTFQPATAVHLGVAVAVRGGGLVAPVLHDADQASATDVMARLLEVATRARSGTLRSSEMTGATLTVTNLGDRGADRVFGVINVPQVAIVGFGAVRDQPVAVDGMLDVRPTVVATLSADHRVSDGHTGSRFLARLDAELQRPETL